MAHRTWRGMRGSRCRAPLFSATNVGERDLVCCGVVGRSAPNEETHVDQNVGCEHQLKDSLSEQELEIGHVSGM